MTTTTKRNAWLLVLLVLAAALAGCSDDDPAAPGGGGDDPPVFEGGLEQVAPPQALADSDDPHAQMAVGLIAMVNGLGSYDSLFEPPAGKAAVDGPPWVYTWDLDDDPSDTHLTYTLTIDETAVSNTWLLAMDGHEGATVYDDAYVLASEEALDESWGWLRVYDATDGANDPIFEWEWTIDAAGTTTVTCTFWEGTPERAVITVHADGSGSVSAYDYVDQAWVLDATMTWEANGDGTWAEYEDGVETGSGSWGSTGGDMPDFGDSYISAQLPDGLTESTDLNAILTTAYVAFVASVEEQMAWLHDPNASKSDGPPWVSTWTVDDADMDVTVTLTVDEDGADWTYEVVVDGTAYGETYADFTSITAREAQDGTEGELSRYELGVAEPTLVWEWTRSAADAVNCQLTAEGFEEPDGLYRALVLADGSGWCQLLEGDSSLDDWTLMWESEWDATGAGAWTAYEGGVESGSGSWSAATR